MVMVCGRALVLPCLVIVCPNWINVCTEPRGLGKRLRTGESGPMGLVGAGEMAVDIRDRSATLTDHDKRAQKRGWAKRGLSSSCSRRSYVSFKDFTCPYGDKYVGVWKEGERHGQGTLYFTVRTKSTGEFREDETWKMTVFDKDGKIISKMLDGVEQKVIYLKPFP